MIVWRQINLLLRNIFFTEMEIALLLYIFHSNGNCFYSNCFARGGRVVQKCWVNFQCRGVLLTWITVGQGPIVLAVGGGCLDIFSLIYQFSFLSPSLREPARYRLKYCLKGPLSPKQPTNQLLCTICLHFQRLFMSETNHRYSIEF